MSVQFILGNSGGGKTHFLYSHLIEEAMAHPDRMYYIIVPEQFTMSTQKQLVAMHPGHSILNIDILSFGRLSYRVLEELGGGEGIVLEDVGKNFLLRRLVNEHKEELKALKGNLKKMGYIDEIKSFLSELAQYRIAPEELLTMKERVQGENLKNKLDDIYLIYTLFLKETEERFITAESRMELVQSKVKDSQKLKGAVFAFDGFTGFTPIQNDLVEELMKISEKIYITATLEKDASPYQAGAMSELFYMSRKFLETTLLLAEETGTGVLEPIWCCNGASYRFSKEAALYALEQNLFRRRRRPYPEETSAVQIYCLDDPKAELTFAAKKIRELVSTGEYRYRDFAVVSGDADGFANYVPQVFTAYEVPYFLDATTNVVFHPLLECISALLQVLISGYSDSSIIAFLKTGFYPLEDGDVERLENYLLACGLRFRSQWQKKWVRNPLSFDAEYMDRLNEIRKELLACFEEFEASFSGDIREVTLALYRLLDRMNCGQSLLARAKAFEEAGDYVHASENEKIYRTVLQVLEKLIALLGEEKASPVEYKELLDAGFRGVSVASIPHGNDCVIVGDIERTRLDQIKVLFFLGVNDGVIPSAGAGGGILSELERSLLLDSGAKLAFGARERALVQRFYLYLNMTKPTERLYLTYAKKNAAQEAKEPSFLIEIVKKIFPKMQAEEVDPTVGTARTELLHFAEQASALAAEKDEDTDEFLLLYRWLSKEEELKSPVEELLATAFEADREHSIGRERAEELFGEELYGSVTKLEKYGSCAFSYFLNYGLRLEERKLHQVETMDIGNILHDAMDAYTGLVLDGGDTLSEVSEEKQETYLEEAIRYSVEKNGEASLFDEERSRYLVKRLERTFRRSVKTVTKQMKLGSYEAVLHEEKFRTMLDLEDGGAMTLTGKIDRVDVALGDETASVRVVDYKSSGRELDLNLFYYGLSLQLITYLNVAMKELAKRYPEKEMLPGGVLYYGMTNPIVSLNADLTEEELEDKILGELRMRGYLNSDLDRILENQKDLAVADPRVAYVDLKKDMTPSANSKVMSAEEFDLMFDYSRQKSVQMGNEIRRGEIPINPYRYDQKTSCDYCPFASVCAFEAGNKGMDYRDLEKLPGQDVIERIREEAIEGKEEA